jgi:hypothetical protein
MKGEKRRGGEEWKEFTGKLAEQTGREERGQRTERRENRGKRGGEKRRILIRLFIV